MYRIYGGLDVRAYDEAGRPKYLQQLQPYIASQGPLAAASGGMVEKMTLLSAQMHFTCTS